MGLEVASRWFAAKQIEEAVVHIHEPHVASWLRCNIWHVQGRDRDLVIDTGMGLRPMLDEVPGLSARPLTAIMTHSHFDHAGGLHEFSHRCGHRAEADVMARPTAQSTVADTGYVRAETFTALPYAGFDHTTYHVKPAPLTGYLDEGDVIDLGDRVFQVFHLPGHSPGSIALYDRANETLFSGDVIYNGDLIDDLYHSEAEVLAESHARLRELPIRVVHAGHFASFGRDRLLELLDLYRDGGLRVGDASAWIAGEMEGET